MSDETESLPLGDHADVNFFSQKIISTLDDNSAEALELLKKEVLKIGTSSNKVQNNSSRSISEIQDAVVMLSEVLVCQIRYDGVELGVISPIIKNLTDNMWEYGARNTGKIIWESVECAALLELTMFVPHHRFLAHPRYAFLISQNFVSAFLRNFEAEALQTDADDHSTTSKKARKDWYILFRLWCNCRFPLHVASYMLISFQKLAKEVSYAKTYGYQTSQVVKYLESLIEFSNVFILRLSKLALMEFDPAEDSAKSEVSKVEQESGKRSEAEACILRRRFLLQPDPNGESVFGLALKSNNVSLIKRYLSMIDQTSSSESNKEENTENKDLSYWAYIKALLVVDKDHVNRFKEQDDLSVLMLSRDRELAAWPGMIKEKKITKDPSVEFEIELRFGDWLCESDLKDNTFTKQTMQAVFKGPSSFEPKESQMNLYEIASTMSDAALCEVFSHHALRDRGFGSRKAEKFLLNSAFLRDVFLLFFFVGMHITIPQLFQISARDQYPNVFNAATFTWLILLDLFSIGVIKLGLDKMKYSAHRSTGHKMSFVYLPEPLSADVHSAVNFWQIYTFAIGIFLTCSSILLTVASAIGHLLLFEWGMYLLVVSHLLGIFIFVDFYLSFANMIALSRPRARGLFTTVGLHSRLKLVCRRLAGKRQDTSLTLKTAVGAQKRSTGLKKVLRFLRYIGRSALFIPLRILYMIEAVLLDTVKFLFFLFIATFASGVALANVYSLAQKQEPLPFETEENVSSSVGAATSLFFAMFGLLDISTLQSSPFFQSSTNYDLNTKYAEIIFGFYVAVVAVLLLNLLISLMVRSAEIVNNRLPAKILRRAIRKVFSSARMPTPNAVVGPFLAVNVLAKLVQKIQAITGGNDAQQKDYNDEKYDNSYRQGLQDALISLWKEWPSENFISGSINDSHDFRRGSILSFENGKKTKNTLNQE